MNKKLSIITPAFNEAENLPIFYERLRRTDLGLDWEWIIVDDHSKDATFAVASSLAEQDARVRVFRLSRNVGSHAAIICGFEQSTGLACTLMAADLQDPPESLPSLLERWKQGAQVVFAVRSARLGESFSKILFSRIYHHIMGRILGDEIVPAAGADFVLLDRVVVDALLRFKERNTSILALITWMGFRQEFVSYVKEARVHGKSGFTLKKCLKLAKDSITSFTALPLRLMCYAGFLLAGLGGLYALHCIVNAFCGHPIQGWSSLMVVVLLIGGFQLLMLGVLGEYLWSALDEIRARPRYLIESCTDRLGKSPLSGLPANSRPSEFADSQQNSGPDLACFPQTEIEQLR
jgi:polyisoprenyl-phosphate glycosyltransferase